MQYHTVMATAVFTVTHGINITKRVKGLLNMPDKLKGKLLHAHVLKI